MLSSQWHANIANMNCFLLSRGCNGSSDDSYGICLHTLDIYEMPSCLWTDERTCGKWKVRQHSAQANILSGKYARTWCDGKCHFGKNWMYRLIKWPPSQTPWDICPRPSFAYLIMMIMKEILPKAQWTQGIEFFNNLSSKQKLQQALKSILRNPCYNLEKSMYHFWQGHIRETLQKNLGIFPK